MFMMKFGVMIQEHEKLAIYGWKYGHGVVSMCELQ